MFYYLEDYSTSSILFIHQDMYLVNNLRAGILDCHSNSFTKSTSTVTELLEHSNKQSNETGIRIVPTGTKEFFLDVYPEIERKQRLIKIRKVAFITLFELAQQYRGKNAYGFHPADPFVIERALSSPDRISEYATIIGLTPEIAEQELSMISESLFIDQFRLFTVCSYWKKCINQLQTVDELNELLPRMKVSFVSPGIANV